MPSPRPARPPAPAANRSLRHDPRRAPTSAPTAARKTRRTKRRVHTQRVSRQDKWQQRRPVFRLQPNPPCGGIGTPFPVRSYGTPQSSSQVSGIQLSPANLMGGCNTPPSDTPPKKEKGACDGATCLHRHLLTRLEEDSCWYSTSARKTTQRAAARLART